MTTTLLEPLADLRLAWRQTLLAVVALVLGLWGIGAILVSYAVLTHDLRQNFLATRPAHAVLVSPDFARLDLAWLRRRAEVEAAELRDLSMQRIEVLPGEWIPLWLFGVQDFRQGSLATLKTQQGAAVPPPGTMLVERDGLLISNLRLGARARVRAAGRIEELPVAGIAFDAAQAPATQDHFIYAYVDMATYASVTGQPAGQRLILRLKGVHDEAGVRRGLQPLLAELAAQGLRVQSVQVPGFEEHPHQWQLDTLLLLQGSIGLLAFLMGALLVSQLMASLLARQVREIGIMKAIGASRAQVLRLYIGMVLAMAALAGAVAAPLAVASGQAFSRFVAGKLNFDILTTQVPLTVALALGLCSLLLPLATALPVLLRGTNRSVLDALTDQAARTPRPVRRRNPATLLTMALGVAIFDTGFNVRQSLADLLADMERSMGHDVQVVLKAPAAPRSVLPLFEGLPNLQRIEAWNGGRGELQSHVVATRDGVGIVALPWDTALFRPRVAAGRWLRGDDAEVVMNRAAAARYGHAAVGGRIVVEAGGKSLQAGLVGIIDELDKAKLYIDQARYDAAFNPRREVNSLMLVARDKRFDQVMALKRETERAIEGSSLDVLYVMSQAERTRVIADHLDIVLTVLVALSLLVLLVSAMGMASSLAIRIQERTREIGVMRAIGATPGVVLRRLVAEGMTLGAASLALGLAAAWPLGAAASVAFGRLMLGQDATLRFAFNPTGLAVVVVVTLAVFFVAGQPRARRAGGARHPARGAGLRLKPPALARAAGRDRVSRPDQRQAPPKRGSFVVAGHQLRCRGGRCDQSATRLPVTTTTCTAAGVAVCTTASSWALVASSCMLDSIDIVVTAAKANAAAWVRMVFIRRLLWGLVVLDVGAHCRQLRPAATAVRDGTPAAATESLRRAMNRWAGWLHRKVPGARPAELLHWPAPPSRWVEVQPSFSDAVQRRASRSALPGQALFVISRTRW